MKWRFRSKTTRALPLLLGAALMTSPPRGDSRRPGGPCDSLLTHASAALQREDWAEGARLSEEAAGDCGGSLEAHYYGAICRRETGKRTSFLLREIQWDKAREHFLAVFSRDSSYRDILYQYAVFREYDDELDDAVEIARNQILRHPEQVESQVGLFRIGRHYIAETDERQARQSLEARPDAYSQFFIAELLRRHGQFKQAETILLRLQETTGFPPQATCLSLARLYASLGKEGEGLAQASYWNGVDNAVSPLGDALVFEDLKPVISDDELERYRGLHTARERIDFFHAFWESRDPAPASPVNARLIEHFRRYAKAEKEYEFFGLRTLATNPDPTLLGRLPQSSLLNHEFNDMGLIFLRHGAPDAIQATSSSGDDNVSWLYNGSGDAPARIYLFARHLRVANDWRLTSLPTDPQMRSKVAMWDYRYGIDPLRWPQVAADLESEGASTVSAALRSEHHRWEATTKEVVVPHAIDAFRAEKGKTLLDISYAITLEDFIGTGGDTARTLPVEVGISFIPVKGGRSRREIDTIRVPVSPGAQGAFVSLFRRTLDPDSLRVSMHVRSAGETVIGTWSEFINVPAFGHTAFSLSDIQLLLPSTMPASIVIDGVRILQSPFRAYRRSAKLYSYLQIYNLVKDREGKTRYTATYDLIPRDPLRPEDSIRLGEVTRDLTEDSRAEFLPVDLSAVPPGRYLFRVTVTDRKRVESLARSREIDILR
jgi:hypothetical protein